MGSAARLTLPCRWNKVSLNRLRIGRQRLRLRAEEIDALSSFPHAMEAAPNDSLPSQESLNSVETIVTKVEPNITIPDSIDIDNLQTFGKELRTSITTDFDQPVQQALESVRSVASEASDNFEQILQSVLHTAIDSRDQLLELAQTQLESLQTQFSEIEHIVDVQRLSVLQSAESVLTELQNQASVAVPPEIKQMIEIVSSLLKSTISNISDNRVPLSIILTLSLGYISLSYFNYRFAGYSGDLNPDSVMNLLDSDSAVLLVDVRPEAIQERNGIPDLRRKSLGKGISVPFVTLDQSLSKILSVTSQLNTDVTAAYIVGHRQATDGTSFVIMADEEDRARAVARSIQKTESRNAFVMIGGYAAWRDEGLPVSERAIYDPSPIDVITDKALDITEPLIKRSVLLPITFGTAATIWVLLNYHYVLQLLGLILPLASFIIPLVRKYDSQEEFLNDVDTFLKSFGASKPMQQTTPEAELNEENAVSVQPSIADVSKGGIAE